MAVTVLRQRVLGSSRDEFAGIAKLALPSSHARRIADAINFIPRGDGAPGGRGGNVANAAYGWGASQCSREYARLFGVPPKRDVRVLRMAAA